MQEKHKRTIHQRNVNEATEDEQLEYIQDFPWRIRSIREPSNRLKEAIVMEDGHNIQYIDDPLEDLQMMALESSSSSICKMTNPSERVKIYAVKLDGWNIRHIKEPSQEIINAALEKDPTAIYFVHGHDWSTIWVDISSI